MSYTLLIPDSKVSIPLKSSRNFIFINLAINTGLSNVSAVYGHDIIKSFIKKLLNHIRHIAILVINAFHAGEGAKQMWQNTCYLLMSCRLRSAFINKTRL